MEIDVREYLDPSGRSPFGRWFAGLNAVAAARVTVAVMRLRSGNSSNVRGVGGGVFEYKIDFGPGYRVDFGKAGNHVVILLGGSTKQRQRAAISSAQSLWLAYKMRKGEDDGAD